ncbi:MAG: aminotransferase class V-fold PLP-dependent enzyme [Deltaproteobacteria bacterium]|nr:aminotransferase class V-fold PLP-dependent enzyme [Deltaproteobacteria bacterium]
MDCNATTPLDPEVREVLLRFLDIDYGNASSRTHEYGARAQQAVQHARDQVAAVVRASRDEVIFTSGATESNNLAIIGLASHGEASGRRHIVSTAIEHKAVLEPLEYLARRGFDVTLVPPTAGGWIDPASVRAAVRHDTLLVSVMHVNNETGVTQDIDAIAASISDDSVFVHVDGAQGFGKDLERLRHPRIDLISVSGHKIFGPKGVGALVYRRRNRKKPPLTPLLFGGGQERGIRPGTPPVMLIAALGMAAELALRDAKKRNARCVEFRRAALRALQAIDPAINGDLDRALPHVLNLSLRGVDSEAAMLALKDVIAISNGSACTSSSYQPSHVLKAMGLSDARVAGALRLSWCHLTPDAPWDDIVSRLRCLVG